MTESPGLGDWRQVGPYRLVGRLGRGGMGRVYLGRSPGGRLVAVKVVAEELAGDVEFRRRFALEVAAARGVGGFYTAQVVDADPDANPPWLVTAYIPGPSLQQAVAAHGPLPPNAIRVLGSGLAEGLAAIHASGVVHRDLKPGNVILAHDGPRVIDFGIARALDAVQHSTGIFGTPGYMSPEQARGHPTGPASDIFSLACVLTYAATTHSPYGEGIPAVVLYRIIHEEPDLTDLPSELAPFIKACLARNPSQRPLVADALRYLTTSAADPQWLPAGVSAMISEHGAASLVLRNGAADDNVAEREPSSGGLVTGGDVSRPAGSRRRRNVVTAALGLGLAISTAVVWITASVLNSPDPPDDNAGETPGATRSTTSTNPCDVIDNTIIGDHRLVSTGTPGGYESGSDNVATCTWRTADFGDADSRGSYTLAYAPSPMETISDPEPDPVDLSGIPSATAYSNDSDTACEVSWRTSFGYATVFASEPSNIIGGLSCVTVADFARSVFPKVPE
ncbi:serine/threonine-protein kinase [Streptomyces litchfieldiae]|uniref:Serine/threonine-protein kinase n=1 Tax=Streptomyces litchfieldiae TaxID=3075543 RepID=A0ABU2MUK7_9ACTN|nr:serine/threonine-protein kinase [Streptomyces sp. DSM 44938]MDT0345151.1 serine/threonine-protein kinase [Streptomyces sp. DSM 44938]